MTVSATICRDDAAIMQVIERETETFLAADFEAWSECWVQDARTRELCFAASHGVTLLQGWEAIAQNMREVFRAHAMCDVSDFQRDNVQISITGDMALVHFEGRSVQRDGRVDATAETRVLERSGGQWRILYASFVMRGHQRDDAARVAVDATGRVLCAPPAAQAAVAAHPGLQIVGGHLRATRRDWDKTLQAGIAAAAQKHRFFQQDLYARDAGQAFRLPVVLGETDAGGVAFCVLFARDERTFVDLQGDGDLSRRLQTAQTIYALSEGQLHLAERIVCGDNLGQAAEALGISINTVKTHLSRIYVKTGVNAQTALVRALLSVG